MNCSARSLIYIFFQWIHLYNSRFVYLVGPILSYNRIRYKSSHSSAKLLWLLTVLRPPPHARFFCFSSVRLRRFRRFRGAHLVVERLAAARFTAPKKSVVALRAKHALFDEQMRHIAPRAIKIVRKIAPENARRRRREFSSSSLPRFYFNRFFDTPQRRGIRDAPRSKCRGRRRWCNRICSRWRTSFSAQGAHAGTPYP